MKNTQVGMSRCKWVVNSKKGCLTKSKNVKYPFMFTKVSEQIATTFFAEIRSYNMEGK